VAGVEFGHLYLVHGLDDVRAWVLDDLSELLHVLFVEPFVSKLDRGALIDSLGKLANITMEIGGQHLKDNIRCLLAQLGGS
jgi:hypothetical protein